MPPLFHAQAVQLNDIAMFVGGELIGPAHVEITGVSSLDLANPSDLTFVGSDKFLQAAHTSRSGAMIVHRPLEDISVPQIVVAHPAYAFTRIVQHFFVPPNLSKGVHHHVAQGVDVTIGSETTVGPFVTLGDRVHIGERVTVHAGVSIGDDSHIGNDSILYPNVTIREGSSIGCRVIIHSGTVVGSDGFGYVQYEGRHLKIPQLGTVVIEDDVELGANVTVDRATFGQTTIQRGTKVDNLVQIAHNVTVGEDTIVVAQVGIAGSTHIGRHVMIGGQVGIADHLTIGDCVLIAAQSGVAGDVSPNKILGGSPAIAHTAWLRSQAIVSRLPEVRKTLRLLEARVQKLESKVRRQHNAIADHLTIGDCVLIAAQSGVAGDVSPNKILGGSPAIAHTAWLRSQAIVSRLPEVRKTLRLLEARVQKLESKVRRQHNASRRSKP